MGKKYTTNFLEDTNGSTGSANQVLISTPTGIDWVDGSGSSIIGGPYVTIGTTQTITGAKTFTATTIFDGDMTLPAAADNFDIGYNLQTTGKIRFGLPSWNNSIGLESYWMVLRTNQNEGLKLIDSAGNIYVQFNASNNTSGAYNSTFAGNITLGDSHFIGDDGFDNLLLQSSSGENLISSAANDLIFYTGGTTPSALGTERLRIYNSDGRATFAGDINLAAGKKLQYSANSFMTPENNTSGAEISTAGTFIVKTGTTPTLALTLGGTQNATFAETIAVQGTGDSYFTGNVGIGTTSPRGKLDIVGNTDDDTDFLTIQDNDPSAGSHRPSIRFRSDTAQIGQILGLDNSMRFSVGTTEDSLLEIASGGNVGIGTTSPQTELHIKGNNGWGEVRIEGQTFASGHGASLEFYSGGTTLADIYANTSKDLILRTNGTTERMRITNAGNVGIGTTSPTHLLNLSESDSNSVQLVIDNTNTTDAGTETSEIRFRHYRSYVAGQNDAGEIIVGKEQAWDAAGDRNSYMAFGTRKGSDAVVEKMRITSAGNVGIGTTSPETITSTVSTLTLNGTSGTVSGGFAYQVNGTTKAYSYVENNYLRHQAQSGVGQYWFADGSIKMAMLSGGNVGIGTTSPATDFHVNSENAEGSLTLSRGGNNMVSGQGVGSIVFPADYNGTPTNYGKIVTYANALSAVRGSIDFKVKSTQGNLLTGLTVYGTFSGANVGIGTTSPESKLEVSSSGANGVLISKDTDTTSNSGRLFFETDTVSEGFSFLNSNGLMTIRSQAQAGATSGNIRVAIDGSGNVGIGTTSPSAKLTIQGTNSANGGIKIQNSGGNPYAIYSDNNDLLFTNGNGSTTALTIAYAGNVGIGTDSPNAKIEVASGQAKTVTSGVEFARFGTSNEASNYATLNCEMKGGASAADRKWIFQTIEAGVANAGNIAFQPDGGNVGIGTTSPGSKLEVKTSGTNTTVELDNSDTDYTLIQYNAQGATKGFSGFNSGFMLFGGEAGVTTRLQAGGNYAATILTNGNFGIGTTSPAEKLEVNGVIQIKRIGDHPAIRFVEDTTTRGYIGTGDWAVNGGADADLGISSAGTGSLILGTNSGNGRVYIVNGGNVGIGTDSPTGKLNVEAAGNHLHLRATTATAGKYWNFDITANNQLFIINNGGTGMTIKDDGNVGIGTTNPVGALSVENTGTAGVPVLDIINTSVSTFNHSGEVMTPNMTTGQNNIIVIGRASSTKNSGYIGYKYSGTAGSNANVLTFGHWGSNNLMNIDGLGNVGIGTTSPAAKLEVKSSANLNSFVNINTTTDAYDSGISLRQSSNYGFDVYYTDDGVSPSVRGLYFDRVNNGSVANAMFIDRNNGNVGIGTTSPTQKLVVIGNIGTSGSVLFDDNQGINFGNSNAKIIGTSADGIKFFGTGSEKMRLTQAGNVGIGETNPGAKLDVNGVIRAQNDNSNDHLDIYCDGDVSGDSILENTNSSIVLISANGVTRIKGESSNYPNASLEVFSGSTAKIKLNSSGDSYFNGGEVGINTTSPSATLHLKAILSNGVPFKLEAHPSTSVSQMLIYATKAYNSTDAWYNLVCEAGDGSGGQTNTLIIERDGDVRNKNNSYGQISDIRLKENITDATPKLEDIKKLKVKNFNFIGEDLKQIGLIAQEVEEVFPGLVKEDKQPDVNGEEGGVYKSVKYSVLVPMLIKAMQEQQEQIDELKKQINN